MFSHGVQRELQRLQISIVKSVWIRLVSLVDGTFQSYVQVDQYT